VSTLALRDSLPVHARLLDSMAHTTDQFTKGPGKEQGLSYASTLGIKQKRKMCEQS